MMGSLLKYILCTDEASSKQIAAKLRENGQIRTLVILGNVTEKKEQISRTSLGKYGHIAL
jgi:precorrin-6B methylase 1